MSVCRTVELLTERTAIAISESEGVAYAGAEDRWLRTLTDADLAELDRFDAGVQAAVARLRDTKEDRS
jgi:hypothetical protein